MVTKTILKKLKNIKEKIKNRSKRDLLKGMILFSGVATAHNALHNTKTQSSSEVEKNNIEVIETPKELSLADITFSKNMVNIAPESSSAYFEFENQLTDKNNNPISDFNQATKYSIWDCSYKREAGTKKNPVGIVSKEGYYGSLQFNYFNAVNMAIYGMLHAEHKDLAAKFFQKTPQLENALANFQKSMDDYAKKHGDENLAYHVGSVSRQKVIKYISPNFKKIFEKAGQENTLELLDLQRAYAGAVYCSFDGKSLKKICAILEASDVKPEEVNPAIWGMFLAKHIKGGFGGISTLLKGKKAKDINSLAFVNAMANKYPDVFKDTPSCKEAWKFAKEHYQEKHSLTTIKELSVILHKPEMVSEYLKLLSLYQKDDVTYEQAKKMAQADSTKQESTIHFYDVLQEKIEANNVKKNTFNKKDKIKQMLLAKNEKTR